MLAGQKPLAMFSYVPAVEEPDFPCAMFDDHVAHGSFVIKVSDSVMGPLPSGEVHSVRTVFYALSAESWRIEAMMLVQNVALQLGWDEGLERVIGKLLGYAEDEIDCFIRKLTERGHLLKRAS